MENSLLAGPSDSSPEIQLHPLVILTISDLVVRRTLRNLKGPVIGALIGLQDGRTITVEVAFDCKLQTMDDGTVLLDQAFFEARLQQYKDVYKSPQLELVGWFTLGDPSGPEQHVLPIQMQLQTEYNLESAILLLFHTELVSAGGDGKLPLTLYETVWTSDNAMEVDGGERNQSLKFRELPYTVETGEAEMISVDFVARGGGNATAVEAPKAKEEKKSKGKVKEGANGTEQKSYLSPEDDELITSLTAKANAIKMLQARLNLLSTYLSKLPPSYLTDQTIPLEPNNTSLNHPILRSTSALLSRLPLLTPPDTVSYDRETQQTKSDVELISLLSSLTRGVQDAKELGRKWHLAEPRKRGNAGGYGPESFLLDHGANDQERVEEMRMGMFR
ncbi:hypothetical protein EJ08DRAFT_664594 [Tothia fuscella]|uniref:COP9 signalosome complex subunit 6 n=1 Tax=Tothia fuscella TaxID=1048955 RepID=A0A9P4TUA5_9PEZI|nr:hypothetical protein EJ08DRAFT_664594 [Tothia fuscella]